MLGFKLFIQNNLLKQPPTLELEYELIVRGQKISQFKSEPGKEKTQALKELSRRGYRKIPAGMEILPLN